MGLELRHRMERERLAVRAPTPKADAVPLSLMPEDCDASSPQQRLTAKRQRLVASALDYLLISGGTGTCGLYAKLMINTLLQHEMALRRKFADECKELRILTENVEDVD